MRNEQITLLYHEMEQMKIEMPMEAELGVHFYRTLLPGIRRHQDRLVEMTLVMNQEASRIGRSIRAIRASLAAMEKDRADHGTEVARLRAELEGLEQESIDLRYLADTIDVVRGNLRQSGMDVRLMLKAIETERELGEITPPGEGEPKGLPGGVETTPADRADW
jgi:hypothetical protein